MDQPPVQVPPTVWQGVSAVLLGAAGWLVHRARRKPRTLLDLTQAKEALREFIDERAEHKVNNAINVLLPRLLRLEDDLKTHLEQTREDMREFYIVSGRQTASMEALKATTDANADRLDELVRMVGELRGRP